MWWLIHAEILEVNHQDKHFNTKIAYWIILWKLFEICQTVEFMFMKMAWKKLQTQAALLDIS